VSWSITFWMVLLFGLAAHGLHSNSSLRMSTMLINYFAINTVSPLRSHPLRSLPVDPGALRGPRLLDALPRRHSLPGLGAEHRNGAGGGYSGVGPLILGVNPHFWPVVGASDGRFGLIDVHRVCDQPHLHYALCLPGASPCRRPSGVWRIRNALWSSSSSSPMGVGCPP
jgi:hypothetical protein